MHDCLAQERRSAPGGAGRWSPSPVPQASVCKSAASRFVVSGHAPFAKSSRCRHPDSTRCGYHATDSALVGQQSAGEGDRVGCASGATVSPRRSSALEEPAKRPGTECRLVPSWSRKRWLGPALTEDRPAGGSTGNTIARSRSGIRTSEQTRRSDSEERVAARRVLLAGSTVYGRAGITRVRSW